MPTGVTLRILTKAGFEPGLSDSFHSARCLLPRSECSFCTFQVLTKRPLENWITRYSRSQLRYSIPVHKCSWEKFFLVLTAKTLEFFVLVDKESFLFSVVHVFTETMNHWHLSQSRFLAGTCEPWGRLQAGTQQLPSCACTPRAPPDTTVISPINCYAILSSGSF